jgi:hypothetical protein
MGVPTSEVGYTSATTGRGDHEVQKEHVVALAKQKENTFFRRVLCVLLCRGDVPHLATERVLGRLFIMRNWKIYS